MAIRPGNPYFGGGNLTAVPAGSTNGTALGTPPSAAIGVRIYLPSAAVVTFTIATAAPTSAPSVTITMTGSSTLFYWDEFLAENAMIYVTAKSGSPAFRWL